MPPTSTLGSAPPWVSSQPVSAVVVVLPCVPAMTIDSRAPEEVVADRFGQRAVADLAVEHLLELGVAARDGVADDHQVEVVGDVLRGVAVEHRDALGGQEVAHRRIDVLVRPATS